MKIRGVSEAIATYLGWDVADLRENRYHYGRTGTLQIFTVGEDYMTACKSDRKGPPYNFKWKLLCKDYFGFDIFYFNPIIDNK